jgi:hypothetical protein
MWTYTQRTGQLARDGVVVAIGYSGHEAGKNNPEMADVPNVGPIPCGMYRITDPLDSPTKGPHVMHLLPSSVNRMFGRSAFLIHGDSREHPGGASHGCIIMSREIRERISDSGDCSLMVVSGDPWMPDV